MKYRNVRSIAFKEASRKYLNEISIKKKSYVNEQSIMRQLLDTPLANKNMSTISPGDILKIRDHWLKTIKPATVVRRLCVLSHMFTVAKKDWGYHKLENPVMQVRKPSVSDARDRRFLDFRIRGTKKLNIPTSEFGWIVSCTRSVEMPVILSIALETAMRLSEICRIQREHINLSSGVLHIPYSKNGTARDIPLTPVCRNILKKFLTNKSYKGRIFNMESASVSKCFARAVKSARKKYLKFCLENGKKPRDYLTNIRFHDARHEATSRLATVFEMHELAKITGHKDTRMLLRYYHPKGVELVRKLNKSSLGKQQLEQLKKS